jgi:hypothetical protein
MIHYICSKCDDGKACELIVDSEAQFDAFDVCPIISDGEGLAHWVRKDAPLFLNQENKIIKGE